MKYEWIGLDNMEQYRSVLPGKWVEEVKAKGFPQGCYRRWLGAMNEEGVAVGSILGEQDKQYPDDFWIDILYVKPSKRRKGIASEMLKILKDALVKDNFTKIDCRCYVPSNMEEKNSPVPFFEHWNFRNFKIGEEYFFDAQKVLDTAPVNPAPDFDFVPAQEDKQWHDAMLKRREATLGEIYKKINNNFFELDKDFIKKMRNSIVLAPFGDVWHIIEHATGKQAGWLSCLERPQRYCVENLCIEPEFRKNIFIWQKAGIVAAHRALDKKLPTLSYEIYFWRPTFQRCTHRFGATRGFQKFIPLYLYRLDLPTQDADLRNETINF